MTQELGNNEKGMIIFIKSDFILNIYKKNIETCII